MSTPPDVPVDMLHDLEGDLRCRATRLRRFASYVLATIVFVLLAGIAVFIAAGALANREAKAAVDQDLRAILDSLISQRKALETELNRVAQTRAQTDTLLRDEIEDERRLGQPGLGPAAVGLEQRLAQLDSWTQVLREQIGQVTRHLTQLVNLPPARVPQEAQIAPLVSTISTRVGAIVLLLFLVQILVPLYRYNVRLASHYESCGDAMRILKTSAWPPDFELFSRVAAVLSPSNVEFGAAPRVPTEEVLKSIISTVGKK